mgnify:CR=1 FL=1
MHKKLLFITLAWLCAMSGMAQSLEIVQSFRKIENSSAVVLYHNQFGQYEKPQMDDTFPYAVVRVLLEGNVHEVTAAKKMLGVYTGVLSQGLKASYLDFENEILFLVPSSSGHVELSCGDGCARQTILELPKLESNALYMGKVHYRPAAPLQEAAPEVVKKQYFKFRIHPSELAGITVLVTEKGQQEPWNVADGIATKKLDYGVYHYAIYADRYHKMEGSFTVSDTGNELDIHLRPQFGWLNVTGDKSSEGSYVFVSNPSTGSVKQIGTIPLQNAELDAGSYNLRIQKPKYKDYLTTISIEEGQATTIHAVMKSNFGQLTLVTQSGAEIWLDGARLGESSWTGPLEMGEYIFETRQPNHRSSYTQVTVSEQSVGKTIPLNNPQPIYGTFEVNGSPADATVYVDGKKVGTTPLYINQIVIGSHKIRIEKDGYYHQEKTVIIAEDTEQLLEYTLSKGESKVDEPVVAIVPRGSAVETISINGVSFNMIKVDGGTFTMGATSEQGTSDPFNDEYPIHPVTLSDFYIGETEVTQELWQAVMGSNPSAFSGTNLPVEQVSWNDCQTFITKLNELTGKTFRLPTEAEWEYAARGGNKSKEYKYAGSNTLNDVAWYGDTSDKTHPVMQKQANELGLYDMSGNVGEWCQDRYGSYGSGTYQNPKGPTSGSYRVGRGGGWSNNSRDCRVSKRGNGTPTSTYYNLGLRLAL